MIAEAERDGGYRYEATVDGHPLRLRVEEAGYNAWKEHPELTWAAAGAGPSCQRASSAGRKS